MSLVDFESNRLFGFKLALLCVTTKPYTLTDLYIFSSIQNYSLKKRAQIQLFHKKHANIPLEINLLIVIICFCSKYRHNRCLLRVPFLLIKRMNHFLQAIS